MSAREADRQRQDAEKVKVEVQKEGFTTLAEGVSPVVDIVFVHGLRGHPKDTWTHTTSTRNRLGKLFGKKRKRVEVYWPLDLLPHDFSNVRILTYGYDSHLAGNFNTTANQSGISDHGQDLLVSLEHIRRKDPKRRIIFVAHSLGGLIVKETLRRSRGGLPYLQDVYRSTYAIIFFGTPHRGTSYAQLGQVAEAAAGIVFTTNRILLAELMPNSPFLRLLREEFSSMVRENKIEAHCFQERKALSNIKGLSKLVVEPDSSSLDDGGENRSSINAHHKAMCRFSGELDPGYVKVEGVISKYLENIENIRHDDGLECLQSLRTPAMYERRDLIETAETHTFEWIFSDSRVGLKNWLVGNDQLFWIKGKPGSGKSTLLKFLCEHDKTIEALRLHRDTNVATASFYFYEQGTHRTQKTFDGLLHGLLHQLLSAIPQLFSIISNVYEVARDSDGWKRDELMRAFAELARQKKVRGCICMFADALDEYHGNPTEIVREVLRLLSGFSNSSLHLKLCISSRPLPEFEVMLKAFPGLSMNDWTSVDIREVVSQRLMEVNRGPMILLSQSIVSEAKGVFLWVKLILKELSPYMFDGESEDGLLERLSSLPSDLYAFYGHMLRLIGPAQRPKVRKILQMIICDGNRTMPLSLAEISLAIILPDDLHLAAQQFTVHPTDDLSRCLNMQKLLNNCLGGFLELAPRRNFEVDGPVFEPLNKDEFNFIVQTVHFSHKTAKEYLLKMLNMDFFEPETTLDNRLAGHFRLMRLYLVLAAFGQAMSYLLLIWPHSRDSGPPDMGDSELINNFLFHAREAECLEYVSCGNDAPGIHGIWNSGKQNSGPAIELPGDAFRQGGRNDVKWNNTSSITKVEMMDAFNQVLSHHNPEWIVEGFFCDYGEPDCFLTFAIIHGLYLYAKDIINRFDQATINRYSPPLLYWAIVSNLYASKFTMGDFLENDMERSDDFVQYLVEKGANPNATCKVPYNRQSAIGDTVSEGVVTVTLIQFALGVVSGNFVLGPQIACLRNVCILLEAGANAKETKYKEYWNYREGVALEASAIHRLVYPLDQEELFEADDGTPIMYDPFKKIDSRRQFCKTIEAFLDHGADPNALDSDGKDVFSCMMAVCPYSVLEYALVKGALISPALLEPDGSPTRKHGILWEARWQRPECYTPEARELVRKHMPQWEELGKVEEINEQAETEISR